MGRIGQAVARRAKAFGMQIHYHNRKPVSHVISEELEATYWESLDQMLARMDFVSVNCPHTPATYHLLSARRLKLLRPHAVVVNTARGEVIDENALTRGLRAGEIAGAGLDVFTSEPPKADGTAFPLLSLPNVVVTPHLGASTDEAQEKAGISVADIAAGMYAYTNILSALLLRGKTGEGSQIDVSMLEAMGEWMGYPLYYAFEGAAPPPRTGASHASIYPYGPFVAGEIGRASCRERVSSPV